jgi:hypothetical protein
MRRHKKLTLCKPEITSLFSTTTFSKTNVMDFFENYECALKSWKFTAERVHNIDETGVSAVAQSPTLLNRLGQNRLDKLSLVNEEL